MLEALGLAEVEHNARNNRMPRQLTARPTNDVNITSPSSFRAGLEWPVEAKRALIALGYEQTAAALEGREEVREVGPRSGPPERAESSSRGGQASDPCFCGRAKGRTPAYTCDYGAGASGTLARSASTVCLRAVGVDDRDPHRVAGLVRGHRVAELFDRGDLPAVELHDHVSAEHEALAGDHDLLLAALEAGLVGRAPVVTVATRTPFFDGEVGDPATSAVMPVA